VAFECGHEKSERTMVSKKKAVKKKPPPTSSDEIAEAFDRGDVSDDTDPEKVTQRVNVDFPLWVVKALDEASDQIGITRQALIKTWIHERLRQEMAKKSIV